MRRRGSAGRWHDGPVSDGSVSDGSAFLPTFAPLVTDRLVVRRLVPEDAAPLSAYRSHPDVACYQGWGPDFALDRARALVESMRDRRPGEDGWFQFAVADRATGALLGDLGLNVFAFRQAEVGVTFAPPAQGAGQAEEALRALLGWGFGPLGLHRVVAGIDPRNARAAALLRRLGFRHEGRLVEAYHERGAWLDEDRFALLAREWTP